MTEELIEHNLHQLNGKRVVVIRPSFGSQSDSWNGELDELNNVGTEFPLRFQFRDGSFAMLFKASDVKKIETHSTVNAVIRLKGPYDYKEQLQPA
jgi:hypothetical protein